MLDGLLNRGFSSKCKSLIKGSRARIEVIRKRAEAKQRFLKEDLAKLLTNGLDINAFGRTEEYVAGMNLLFCYDFIDQTCEYIVKQLSRMQKQGQCPEECRDAVGSLMFAAARFSDLPELRELRDTCQQRYGNLDGFVNQKFVEKLSKDPPSSEKRIKVLQDIASEYSIRWDSRGFEQRMATPLAVPKVKVDVKNVDALTPRPVVLDEKNRIHRSEGNVPRRDKYDHIAERHERVHYREKSELKSNSPGYDDILSRGKHTRPANEYSYFTKKDDAETSSGSSHGKTFGNGVYSRHGNEVNNPKIIESTKPLFRDRTEFAPNHVEHRAKSEIATSSNPNQDSALNSMRNGYEQPKSSSDYSLPPPYVKKSKDDITPPPYNQPKEGKQRDSRGRILSELDRAGRILNELDYPGHQVHQNNTLNSAMKGVERPDQLKPSLNHARPPPYVKSKDKIAHHTHIKPEEDYINPFSCKTNAANSSGRSHQEPNHPKYEEIIDESAKASIYGYDKELARHGEKNSLQKPRSSRRKHHKSSSYDVDSGFEDVDAEKRGSSSSKRKDPSRKGLQTMFAEEHNKKDDEEKMIDKLLIHYCKKPSSSDAGKLRKKYHGQAPGPISTDDDRDREVVPHPSRSVSLPSGQAASPESKRLLTRVNTFQPDNAAKHVHPKLPDYDDLAARFAALRGN